MIGGFSDVIRTIDAMKADGVIVDYAIGGAVAFAYWDEPVPTSDLDVVVIVSNETHALDPLRPILKWLDKANIPMDGAHAVIAGVPVQFLPAWHPLVAEGVQQAVTAPYDPADPESVLIRIVPAAHLVASWKLDPSAYTFRRRERAARLLDAGIVTQAEVDELLGRHQ